MIVRQSFEHWTGSNDRGMQFYTCVRYAIMIGTTRPRHSDGCSTNPNPESMYYTYNKLSPNA